MNKTSSNDLTQMLLAWTQGDEQAFEKLSRAVYGELRRLAQSYMRNERREHTLQPTALVNEAFLRMIDWKNTEWKGRSHFFAVAAQMMRRILVDHARRRNNGKRGGKWNQVTLTHAEFLKADLQTDLVAIDDALKALEQIDRRKSQVVELRFFAGLTVEEAAEALHVSPDTVLNDWRFAKAWLLRELAS